jgi:hypothetical protein
MKTAILVSLLFLFVFPSFESACPADDNTPPTQAACGTVSPACRSGSGKAPRSLTTIFANNGAGAGNMFDITTYRPLKITGIDVNADPAGLPVTVNVYWRSGTSFGFENSSVGWTLLDTGTGTTAGADLPTYIDLPGASQSFPTDTYGLYVSFVQWPSVRCQRTNGGPNHYSNSDLDIYTNCSNFLPEFTGGSFHYRIWNGTIYYDDGGPDLPSVDITCNGEDSGVSMYAGTNARVDYSFHAGIGAGVGVDLWLAIDTPIGFFSHDGNGPYMGWNYGLRNAFHTGPLADTNGTCLDFALGTGNYKAFAAIDSNANGVLNMGNLYAMDVVGFDVLPPPQIYSWDDSTTENLLCWSAGGEICWFSRFTAFPGGETIVDMHCLFGSVMYPNYAPGNGTVTDCYVWNDPTNDGDPTDAVLISQESIVVANVDTDTYNVYPLTTPAVISGEFFVGCNMPHLPSEFCAPIDQTTPYVAGDSFYCGDYTGAPFDPNNLMNNSAPPAEWGNYFCVRAGY